MTTRNTKQRIISKGAEIINLKGFHHTGIQEILDAANVPKGSFYNYFRSKDDFGLQVIDYYVQQFAFLLESVTKDSSLSPIEKTRKILLFFMDFYKSRDYAYGCPIGNLSQEMGDLSPVFREKLKHAVDAMVGGCIGVLEEAQKAGEISSQLDLKETAYFILSSWHGALLRMKVEKSLAPLENHYRFIFDYILKPEPRDVVCSRDEACFVKST
ncbi:MAG TPA: TetR family transcriptional regulator C-terminal domain-containing protein [Syntrophales bacterium]|nr:TetR family transcriptional regulator C-terminal domain-containing protein [Syntrophales bacterium]